MESRWGQVEACTLSLTVDGWSQQTSSSGLRKCSCQQSNISRTVNHRELLIFDGHHSHISLELIELARANNIQPSSPLLQPLDVGVFGPVKAMWKKLLKEHQIMTCAVTVTKEDSPGLIAQLWKQSFKPSHLNSGFRKTGLCPLSRDAILTHRLAVSSI